MNYKTVNSAIINGQDVSSSIKNKEFYKYSLDNNVAYYYAKLIAKQRGEPEKKILEAGSSFNSRYIKTLTFLCKASEIISVKFALFKTFKHIPEAVDGDVDIFIRKRDFGKFINLLESEGFDCEKEAGFKTSCIKKGFCKIEPRADISFHGKTFLTEEIIWKHLERERIGDLEIYRSSIGLDMYYFLLNTLYGPNYIKLYHYLVFKKADHKKMFSISPDNSIREDLRFIAKRLTNENSSEIYFPFFLDDLDYLSLWFRRILFDRNFNMISKFKNLIFFFYAKYEYLFFGRLPFRHDWNVL